MENYKEMLDLSKIPAHIGIIMDGNGRWAEKRSKSRGDGHRQGSEVIEPVITACIELKVKAVSLYAFSYENWSRPKTEIFELWRLLEFFFSSKLDLLISKGIRIVHSGSTTRLPAKIQKLLTETIKKTANNKAITLNLCINYGGRQEIVEGVNKWLDGRKPDEKFTVKKMEKHLYTASLPEVDMIIRTSGEFRISNFLLWQTAYTELVFTDVLWPDFTPLELYKAIYYYQQRKRRFGNI